MEKIIHHARIKLLSYTINRFVCIYSDFIVSCDSVTMSQIVSNFNNENNIRL